MRLATVFVAPLLVACTQEDPADTDVDTQVAVCSASDTDACLYLGGPSYAVTVSTQQITDPDRLGQPDRPIRMARYEPLGAPEPMPVVVVSHGGSSGLSDPLNVLEEWSARLAQRGFYVVSIAHTPRSDGERQSLCQELGASMEACRDELKPLNYDRPRDVALVLTALEGQTEAPFDIGNMAYLGHSAGAGSAMMLAGAERALFEGATPDVFPDDRPVAFVGLSPQGIDDDGFFDGSWDGVDRPFLTATGLADGDSEAVARGRRDPFDGMPAGGKYRLWLEDPAAEHGLFAGNDDACVGPEADAARCAELGDWVRSAVYAFLDDQLRGDARAAAWLASDDVVTAGAGVVEWDRK